jgi:hypothetical protein
MDPWGLKTPRSFSLGVGNPSLGHWARRPESHAAGGPGTEIAGTRKHMEWNPMDSIFLENDGGIEAFKVPKLSVCRL